MFLLNGKFVSKLGALVSAYRIVSPLKACVRHLLCIASADKVKRDCHLPTPGRNGKIFAKSNVF